MKRTLVVKEEKTKIKVFETHIEIATFYEIQHVGFNQTKAAYINKKAKLSVGDALLIARHVPLYFIDKKGNILGKICTRR